MIPWFDNVFGRRVGIPDSVTAVTTRELLAISLFCLLIMARNVALVVDGFGEQDAARMFNDALLWHHIDSVPFGGYRPRVVPGYLLLTKSLLDSGIPLADILRSLNYLNAFVGGLTVFFSYLVLRTVCSAQVSAVSVFVFSFMPSVFFASIYGFPNLLAYTAFLVSVLLFIRFSVLAREFALPLAVLSAIAFSVATVFKADVVLLGGVYFALPFLFGRVSLRAMTGALLVLAAGVGAPVALEYCVLPSLAAQPGTPAFMADWSGEFPFSARMVVSARNRDLVFSSVGPVFAGLAALGILGAAVLADSRRVFWVGLVCTAPLAMFWGGRSGNSARHMMGLALPTAAFAGLFLHRLSERINLRPALGVLTGVAIAANYFSSEPSRHTVRPSSRLVESALLLRESTAVKMRFGEKSVDDGGRNHFLIDSHTLPYSRFSILKNARSVEDWAGDEYEGRLDVTLYDGKPFSVSWAYVKTQERAEELAGEKRDAGFVVWSMQYPGL